MSGARKDRYCVPFNFDQTHDIPGNSLNFSIGLNWIQTLFLVQGMCFVVDTLGSKIVLWNLFYLFEIQEFLVLLMAVPYKECHGILNWSRGLGSQVHNCLIKGFKADLFLISQLQLIPHLRKLKIQPSTINYVPVGHNCDFGYLLDH